MKIEPTSRPVDGHLPRESLAAQCNRQLNVAINRPDTVALLRQRTDHDATGIEALRSLRWQLSDVAYRAMMADAADAKQDLTECAV